MSEGRTLLSVEVFVRTDCSRPIKVRAVYRDEEGKIKDIRELICGDDPQQIYNSIRRLSSYSLGVKN